MALLVLIFLLIIYLIKRLSSRKETENGHCPPKEQAFYVARKGKLQPFILKCFMVVE